jgi:predicted HTH domain antitoxin
MIGVKRMRTRSIDIPEELLDLFNRSRLGSRSGTDQVRTALAIHLFLAGLASIGKAAELAGEPRAEFEWLLAEMGLPTVRYELADYEEDLRGLARAQQRQNAS